LRSTSSTEEIHAALNATGLRLDARAEQLSLSQFAEMFRQLRLN
jgi:16S rRNA A1518/A1519 N6-dimethyltransferase RsmA/KsgA/DIM1 with predicted DNA glycosylase/AP lyase activity